MKTNVGTVDGALRFIFGIGILHFAISAVAWWGFFGVLLIASAMASWCPIYWLLHGSSDFSGHKKRQLLKRTAPAKAHG